jgi:glycosyltransferase involved in cell wall biosynthesis
MPKRLLIVEEALKNRRGHWYEYNLAIVTEARRQGIEVTVLAHRDLEEGLRLELKAVPFFPVTSWDQVYYHPSQWRRYIGILRHNFRVARWMRRHFASNDPYDVVLVPTVVLYHWLAWRWLAWRYGGRCFQKLVLTTRNNAGDYNPVTRTYQFKSSAKVLRKAVKSFAPLVKSGLVELASDSSRLASQYKELSGLPFSTYPHPRPSDHLPPVVRARDPNGPLVFSALGPPRYEKGSDLILEAIRLARQRRPELRLRFVLQWTMKVYNPSKNEVAPSAELEADPQVEIIRRDLSSAEYQQRIEDSDVLLLPYRRSQYHARLSGIAIEAFQSGVPCICISDTWIADAMQSIGSGIAIEVESAKALADGIIDFTEGNGELRARAIERLALARTTHAPRQFVDMLFANVPPTRGFRPPLG